jgi:enamine deaminase RidA (YjgF/YER057c/UK114 family)
MPKRETICPESWRSIFQRYTFAPAVKQGNSIFLCGLTAVDFATGKFIGEGDIVAQTRQIFRNMQQVLEEAGASIKDIVQTTDYIITTEGYRETAQVRREFFGDDFPASTGIIVAGLLRREALIEINAIAIVPD